MRRRPVLMSRDDVAQRLLGMQLADESAERLLAEPLAARVEAKQAWLTACEARLQQFR